MPPSAQPPTPTYPIESVDNALKLLLLFRGRSTVRAAEASRHLEVAPSTAHRLLAMLQYHGFVEKDPDSKAYRPGMALTEIGLAVIRDRDIRSTARPTMERLVSELDETAHLALLERTEVLVVDSVESTRLVRVGSRIGYRLPAHTTSLGKAMLAYLPEVRVTRTFPTEYMPADADGRRIRRRVFLDSLREVAALGYAVNVGEVEDDVVAVGVPILSATGVPVAAISISAPQSRCAKGWVEKVAPVMREAAVEVASRL
jgi:IclR family transcriptional regulator, acetate operon repressor